MWRKKTLVSPYDFAIQKDPEVLRQEQRQIYAATPPIFAERPGAAALVAANRDSVLAQLNRIRTAYKNYRYQRDRGRYEAARADSVRYAELRGATRLKLTPEQWQSLLTAYLAYQPEFQADPRAGRQGVRAENYLAAAAELGEELLRKGVLNVPLDSIRAEHLVVRNEQERQDQLRHRSSVYGLAEASEEARRRFSERYPDARQAALALAFFQSVAEPSLVLMRAETEAAIARALRRLSPTQGIVQASEVIVRENDLITPEVYRKLRSFEALQRERAGPMEYWKLTLGRFVLTLATYLMFFLYLFLLRRPIYDDLRKLLLVSVLLALTVASLAVVLRLPSRPVLAAPVAIVSVLLTVIFDSRVGLLGTLTLALIGGHLLNSDFGYAFATVFAGILGVFSVRDIKNRGQFFLSAGLVFVGYAAAVGGWWLVQRLPLDALLESLLHVGINSFLLIMAYPLLWVFERTFDITTDLTLLELSDTNRPLLKDLSLRAPGTFNHSLQVANLAEAAADAIGANALLTRVGALYHDVGKMLKPEYYVENQRPGENPHDQLKPRMSALIIASHVKDGVELGRQYRLPERVLRFIPMHHGTTRIEYFYRKAAENTPPHEPPVQESEFRYPGPRPDSKEAGILMLADSVEAASRSLAEPTHKRLETLIDMVFRARTEDGQLNLTNLTFADLTIVKETFLMMLLGIYHVRIKYPEPPRPEAGRSSGSRAAAGPIVSLPEPSRGDGADGPPGAADGPPDAAEAPAAEAPPEAAEEAQTPLDERALDLKAERRAGPSDSPEAEPGA